MKTLLLALALAVSLSAAELPPLPPALEYNGRMHLIVSTPVGELQAGDVTLLRKGMGFLIAEVGQARGDGVYRIRGLEFQFISPENYAGKMVPLDDYVKLAQAGKLPQVAAVETAAPAPAPVVIAKPTPPAPVKAIPEPAKPVAVATPPPVKPAAPVAAETKPSAFYDDLLKLEDLKSRGILTEQEFTAAKAKVLARIQ